MDYQGDFQYENGVLQFIAQSEGYIYKDATGYRYVYQYKDHLGNNRLSFMRNAGTVAIVKETNYYPFGLTHKGYNNITTSLGSAGAKKYQYNGKELQEDYGLDWYDYGARFYDPAIARWTTIDPKAELSRRWSPYNYAVDNPIRFIDPDGMDWYDVDGGMYWRTKSENPIFSIIYSKGDLGKNAIIIKGGAADKNGNVKESINGATFSLYTPNNKNGATATMVGNTIPADQSKYATVAAQTADGVKTTYKGTPAIKLNNGGKVATTKKKPNPASDYSGKKFADGIYIHAGNKNYKRLTTSTGKPISTGCQTGENGNRKAYLKFMKKVPAKTHITVVIKREEKQ